MTYWDEPPDEWAYDQELQSRAFYSKVEAIPKSLLKFIKTRDKRHKSMFPSQETEMTKYFYDLLAGKKVKVGGRSSCGGKADPTWVSFGYWNEIVRKAVLLGYDIEVTPQKIPNRYASNNGGFWDENEYLLKG